MIQSNILTSWEAYLEPNSTDTEQYNIAQNHTHYHDDRDIILRQEQLTPPIPTHWVPLLKGLRPVLVAEVAMIFLYDDDGDDMSRIGLDHPLNFGSLELYWCGITFVEQWKSLWGTF